MVQAIHFRSGILSLDAFRIADVFQPYHLLLCILQAEVCIHRDPDIAVARQILERLRIHSRARHVAAVRLPADMRRDGRHLHTIDVVIAVYHVLKPVNRNGPVISKFLFEKSQVMRHSPHTLKWERIHANKFAGLRSHFFSVRCSLLTHKRNGLAMCSQGHYVKDSSQLLSDKPSISSAALIPLRYDLSFLQFLLQA